MISAIVLAAGESRRMGQPKLLLPFGDTTIIERIVATLADAHVEEIVVVVGHVVDAVERALIHTRARVVLNADYRTGMLSSVRAGIRSVGSTTGAILLALGDQPSLQRAWIDALVQSHRDHGGGIHVPLFEGRRGHPLLFDASFCTEILHGYDEVGLRGLLHAHPDHVHEVPMADARVLEDLDTPDDYARAVRALDPPRESV